MKGITLMGCIAGELEDSIPRLKDELDAKETS
jgi:hypothetical protein